MLLLMPALLLASTGVASAQAVYSQPGTETCDPSCWTSHYNVAGSGFRAFDNFTFSTDAQITSVSWQGIYIGNPPTGTAPGPNTFQWDLGFFADSGNAPGAAIYAFSLPAASVTTTQIGSGMFESQAVNLYAFEAALPLALDVGANTQYWFSPLSRAANFLFSPFFSWSPATATFDGYTFQTDNSGNIYSRPNDRAFALAGTAMGSVPEPATWGLMILGFGAVGAAMRRGRVRTRVRFA